MRLSSDLTGRYEPSIKYSGMIPEIRYLPVSCIHRQEMDHMPEVWRVSDAVAHAMDFREPVEVVAFRDGMKEWKRGGNTYETEREEPLVTLIDGHHRLAAALQTGKPWLPVTVKAVNAMGSKLNNLIALSVKIEQGLKRNPTLCLKRNPTLYHGAQKFEGPPRIVEQKKGHAEHGPGIYLTTSWDTAKKYAKGGGSIYAFTLPDKLNWADDVTLDLEKTVNFVNKIPRLPERLSIIERLTAVHARRHNLSADVLINLFVNAEASAGKTGLALSQFLIDQGVDAVHVRQNGEDWVVVINPDCVLSVEKLNSKAPVSHFPRLR